MIQLNSVSKIYSHNGSQRTQKSQTLDVNSFGLNSGSSGAVLDRVNLELKQGEFLYVIGGSGAGKTSLLRILATEELPSSGEVSLFGYSLNQCSSSTLKAIRRAIGYIPQSIRLIGDLTVLDNIQIALSAPDLINIYNLIEVIFCPKLQL